MVTFMATSFNNLGSRPRTPIILCDQQGINENGTIKMIQITTYGDKGGRLDGLNDAVSH